MINFNFIQAQEQYQKDILQTTSTVITDTEQTKAPEANWNFIVYLAANNTLSEFASHNIEQMKQVGSNKNLNILVQLDKPGFQTVKHIKINKGSINTEETLSLTSGTRESLFECARWAIKNHPAKHVALILWNHGSGPIDPQGWGRSLLTYRDDLLILNSETGLLEVNTDLLRGIAFNDEHGTYLNNNDLTVTLERISNELLGGKKIDIVAMDACYMASVEIASQIKNSTNYFVASQEMEPGPGWNYSSLLQPISKKSCSPDIFAQCMVAAFQQQYQHVFASYTQSATNMSLFDPLEQQATALASTMIALLNSPYKSTIFNIINEVRSNSVLTTAFARSQYIDLHHFYKSLLQKTKALPTEIQQIPLFNDLATLLQSGMDILQNSVIRSAAGPRVKNAKGLSVYFPLSIPQNVYAQTIFAQKTNWHTFLLTYTKALIEKRRDN